ncbi:MAG: nucleotide exchange factor GrpE, partial [Planctomycetes bacterium]|nr:nucleotide exchange factor GrpE [Planctomycetota bacterium]
SKRQKKKDRRKIEVEASADEVGAEVEAESAASEGLVEGLASVGGDSGQEIEGELEDLKQRFQRLGADFQNYQKRSHRQIDQAAQMARDEMALSMLGVLDNFEHALEKGQEVDNVETMLDGIRIVYDHLLNALSGFGLQRIEVKSGEVFDPTRHAAMMQEESDEWPENTIVRELSPGYVMKDRTLRPAKVSVTKPPLVVEEEAPPLEEGADDVVEECEGKGDEE